MTTEAPKVVVIDVLSIVEALDTKRHEPTVSYEFSNGRKFRDKGTDFSRED